MNYFPTCCLYFNIMYTKVVAVVMDALKNSRNTFKIDL